MDDIKEFLKGQSNKVLVILLILTLPAFGWLLWDKINSKPVDNSGLYLKMKGDSIIYTNAIIQLQKQVNLIGQNEYLEHKKIRQDAENRDEFLVKKLESKNSQKILDAFEMGKSLIAEQAEYKSQFRVDTVYQTKIEKVIQEKTIFVKDTIQKKGLLAKLFKNK